MTLEDHEFLVENVPPPHVRSEKFLSYKQLILSRSFKWLVAWFDSLLSAYIYYM
ncbi:MAG: hypothetical protein NZ875_06555 [Pseudothermotoga sp.]|nr:hypothetical protein [Pseudothermotoga sp.]MDW8140057.1 hypothetical protein [Pseudothermotoga sp.]